MTMMFGLPMSEGFAAMYEATADQSVAP